MSAPFVGGGTDRSRRWVRSRLAPALPGLVAVLGVVVAWDLGVRVFEPAPYLLPAPGEVWSAASRTREVLADHLVATVSEAVAGLVTGAVAGSAVAMALSLWRPLRRAVEPLLVMSQSVPAVVLAPLLIVWVGFEPEARVLVVALIAFFPVAVATLGGLSGADAELVELLRGLGAGRWTILRAVRVPSALPELFSGLRVAAAYAMFGAVVAEWMGAPRGLGVYLARSQDSFRTDQVFVAVALIAAVSVALFGVVALLSRLATPWHVPGSSR